jgi:lipopolysaccharide export system protein LptA
MTTAFSLPARALLALAAALALAPPAQAENADRAKPLNVVADRQGTFDLARQVIVFAGNVVVTKGTLAIQADRLEVREGPDGHRSAVAIGSAAQPARFRQRREGVDEYIEGQADRLEYDESGPVVRFIDNAVVRRLRGGKVADEITGNLITYNDSTEVFSVSGGTHAPGHPGGRVRAVLTPRETAPAAAASQPSPPLRPSPSLGDKP